MIISPQLASELSFSIYDVKNNNQLKAFSALFSNNLNPKLRLLSASVGSRLINTRDAFGICARGANQYANDAFIIFRGTTASNYGADFFTDGRSGLTINETGSFVHSGFNQAFNSVRNDLAAFLGQQQGVQTVHCIGHSLGGAVANLAAEWISQKYSVKVKLYTFGAPRVGLGVGGFATKITKSLNAKEQGIYRVYHNNDPVPMVPLFPFIHAPVSGKSYYFLFGGGFIINPSAHKMTNYVASVGNSSWSELYRPAPSFTADITAWLKSERYESTHTSTFWEKLNNAAAFVVQRVLEATLWPPMAAGLTVVDYLAIILSKGISLVDDVSKWVFLLIRKMARAIGMKVANTIEEITEIMIRQILKRLLQKIYTEIQKALRGGNMQ